MAAIALASAIVCNGCGEAAVGPAPVPGHPPDPTVAHAAPDAGTLATPPSRSCVPAGDLAPYGLQLAGDSFGFCMGSTPLPKVDDLHCFTVDLAAKTLSPVPTPASASSAGFFYPEDDPVEPHASVEPSPKGGRSVTLCTADKTMCRAFAHDMSEIASISRDGALVATVARRQGRNGYLPDRVTTWSLASSTKIATFDVRCFESGVPEAGEGGCNIGFLGNSLLAWKAPCAQPCSTGHIYNVHGRHLGTLAVDPSDASIDHFHDDLYVLAQRDRSTVQFVAFTVQNVATTKVVFEAEGAMRVAPDRIVAVSGRTAPVVRMWGRDLKLVMEIAVPTCAATTPASGHAP